MTKLRPIWIYLILMVVAISGYALAAWNGYAFYNDRVEKNTEYKGANRSGYINRFYHK
jgi:hypothetical protein